ncbi:hypothetical protein [Gelatiniphilus marinus]|uniref:Uncharacterized protein n=1 Tax=Gelatiniphilus marinus TaxID=1759464 RepID=A0ABW5JXT3_9FLAO
MIEQKKKQRFEFLEKLYKETNGSESYMVNMWELGQELEYDRETTSNIVEYLQGEDLLVPRALGGGIAITHYGIKEIEDAYEYPNKPTEHFMPINVINIENMNNSSIQQGTTHSTQNNHFDNKELSDLKQIISELQNVISKLEESDLKEELVAENETLISQSKSPKPKKSIVKETLKSIKEVSKAITIETITTQLNQLIDGFLTSM